MSLFAFESEKREEMKRAFYILFLFTPAIFLQMGELHAQVTVFEERFENRDLTANPPWTGDLSDFSFTTENGNVLLQLDAQPDPSRTQIVTRSNTVTGSWEFYFRQAFNPSNLNRAFIFLMADRADLNYLDGSIVNGYAVRTGDNDSPRKLKLVRFDGGNQTILAESDIELSEDIGYRVRVSRSNEGEWILFMSEGYDSEPVIQGDPVTDSTHRSSDYFGLLLRYSAGNTSGFFFDEFIITSSEPFRLTGAEVVSSSQIALRFNYPINPESATLNSAEFSNLSEPFRVETDDDGLAAIYSFPGLIDDGEYDVSIQNFRSVYGDLIKDGSKAEFSFQNPFYIVESEVQNSNSLRLRFSLRLSEHSVVPGNFLVNESLYPSGVSQPFDGDIDLQFGSEIPSGPVNLTFINLKSEEGWRIHDGFEITTFRFDEARSSDIVINEILYRRASGNEPEFVELYNTRDSLFSLAGWRLETDRGAAVIGDGFFIRERDFVLFTDRQDFAAGDERAIYLPGFPSLRNTGDAVVLRSSDGVVIDSLYYLPEWGGNSPGISLERRDPDAISIDPANWAESVAEAGSTPLIKNSRFEPDRTPPRLLYAGLLPETDRVVARFSEFIQPVSETTFTLSGLSVNPVEEDGVKKSELYFEALELPGNRDMILEAEGVMDFQGNRSELMSRPVARIAEPNDLVFNELMFDPIRDDYDGLPNQTEYLEIVNRQNYAISLEGFYLHDRPDENGNVREMIPKSTVSKWIPAGGYAILQANDGTEMFDESGNARFFGLGTEHTEHVLQFDRSTLSLSMGGREVYLADSTGRVIDWIDYRPEWHNPNLIDTKGISLERINPHGETNDPENWGSNATAIGGTPGQTNSLFQIPSGVSDANSISLEPNPFSPDGDGHEDHLFINYRFDEPGFLLRVRIFDRFGRLVRNLADSHHAGFSGTLTWDGRMDNGVTGRIGIYIVHIEAYNSASGARREFKETAVLARQF